MQWYDTCPTVWSYSGQTMYINFPDDRLPQDKPSQAWVEDARKKGGYPVIYTRLAAVQAVAAAKADTKTIAAATLDVALPSTGTADAKAQAVAAKEQTVLTVAEWAKVEAAVAVAVAIAAPMDEVPVEEKPVDPSPVEVIG